MLLRTTLQFPTTEEPLVVYFDEVVEFQQIANLLCLEHMQTSDDPADYEGFVECKVGLISGNFLFCSLPEGEVSSLSEHPEVVWCVPDNTRQNLHLIDQEEELNRRARAAYSLMTSHPDQELRESMVREFLKRKAAFVAAVEAMVHGMTNEQSS